MTARHATVAIIGSGPAGLTAAIYNARAELKPTVFVGPESGGQLATTTDVENYPGFPEGVMGPELMEHMRQQAERFGATFINESVTAIDVDQRPFRITTENGGYTADAIIVATGASPRWLGLPNETRLRGHGVSSCATCDGFFFRGKEIAVVGGGDTALEEATFLTRFATKVHIIHRRNELRASKPLQERAKADPKINFIFDTVVEDIVGETAVNGLKLRNVKTAVTSDLPVGGVFVAIGHIPNSRFLKGAIDLDDHGYVVKPHDDSRTSVEGVFVAGDVHDHRYQQAVYAAGLGCQAALDLERYLAEKPVAKESA